MSKAPSPLMQDLITLAMTAGQEIMAIYASDFSAKAKEDLTPVTEADEAAEKIILAGLAKIDPATPVISEEAAAADKIPETSETFFLVDPLDGTKEFISRNGEFTVNIARIHNGRPIAGVVYAPALRRIFWGEAGTGAAQGQLADDDSIAWTPIAVLGRVVAQVLPRRVWRGRPLPPLWPHHGMGHGGGPCRRRCGGRQGDDGRRHSARLWQARTWLRQSGLHRQRLILPGVLRKC